MKKVLVCPLDWGLGHATRCVPIVWELQKQGAHVIIASSGAARDFLKLEFPALPVFELPSYQPVYPTTGMMMTKMALQTPKFKRAIKEEHEVTRNLVREHKVDIVMSDNRYGCWSEEAQSIFITHQGSLLMPAGFGWLAPLVNFFGDRHTKNFDHVWIPDQLENGLTTPFVSGTLTNQKYVGWLSRFQKGSGVSKRYEIIALVSGPEPQRKILEGILASQLRNLGLKSLLVEGRPGSPSRQKEGFLERVNHLSTPDLEDAILASDLVIARSGYSTIMDLIALGKKAIFIPTPGQTEQEYLAKELERRGVAYFSSQRNFNLAAALGNSKNYSGFADWQPTPNLLTHTIKQLLTNPNS